MKYTIEERLNIGRQIYNGEITKYQAADMYNISVDTAKHYSRLYREENDLPPKRRGKAAQDFRPVKTVRTENDLEAYESMSKEELIQELVKARIREARLKKGYEVKGDGTVVQYASKNTK